MKTFDVKVKSGDHIQLYGNVFLHMMGISRASGVVEDVRGSHDGFTFKCHETKQIEVIEEGDGEIRILERNR